MGEESGLLKIQRLMLRLNYWRLCQVLLSVEIEVVLYFLHLFYQVCLSVELAVELVNYFGSGSFSSA